MVLVMLLRTVRGKLLDARTDERRSMGVGRQPGSTASVVSRSPLVVSFPNTRAPARPFFAVLPWGAIAAAKLHRRQI